MAKPTLLKIDGKPIERHLPPPTIQKVCAFLDKAPADELFTLRNLVIRCGVAHQSAANYATDPRFAEYRHATTGLAALWGNPKAIAEYRRQIAEVNQ